MGVFLGVVFHARTQTVCWCDTADGVVQQRTLDHRREDVRAFYQQFPAPAVVGLENRSGVNRHALSPAFAGAGFEPHPCR